ncbi:uncharacterized protein DUF3223 [Rhizobium sp. PP-WC-1G-195]|nr:uncharacterized protein DUF3223 [Rhizobium sp. PP-WC-1G-195]
MAKKAVRLNNGKEWPSQRDAINYFRDLRNRHPVGAPILDPSDHNDLLALLERYDLAIAAGPAKTGIGVDHFETRVDITNGGRNVGFWVVRIDGSETDFSFIRAVNEAPKRELEQLSDACRDAVFPELQTAKALYFATYADSRGAVQCAFSGTQVFVKESALDYLQTSFAEIVKAFASSKGWMAAVPPEVISEPTDGQTTTTFVAEGHAAAFRQFHRASAKICVVNKASRGQRLSHSPTESAIRFLEL